MDSREGLRGGMKAYELGLKAIIEFRETEL